jgi:hypothetical protein
MLNSTRFSHPLPVHPDEGTGERDPSNATLDELIANANAAAASDPASDSDEPAQAAAAPTIVVSPIKGVVHNASDMPAVEAARMAVTDALKARGIEVVDDDVMMIDGSRLRIKSDTVEKLITRMGLDATMRQEGAQRNKSSKACVLAQQGQLGRAAHALHELRTALDEPAPSTREYVQNAMLAFPMGDGPESAAQFLQYAEELANKAPPPELSPDKLSAYVNRVSSNLSHMLTSLAQCKEPQAQDMMPKVAEALIANADHRMKLCTLTATLGGEPAAHLFQSAKRGNMPPSVLELVSCMASNKPLAEAVGALCGMVKPEVHAHTVAEVTRLTSRIEALEQQQQPQQRGRYSYGQYGRSGHSQNGQGHGGQGGYKRKPEHQVQHAGNGGGKKFKHGGGGGGGNGGGGAGGGGNNKSTPPAAN